MGDWIGGKMRKYMGFCAIGALTYLMGYSVWDISSGEFSLNNMLILFLCVLLWNFIMSSIDKKT